MVLRFDNIFSVLPAFAVVLLATVAGAVGPDLIAPADDARFGATDGIVIFEWEDSGNPLYEIELGIDDVFAVASGPLPAGSANFYNLSDLIPDDVWQPLDLTIYWRVRGTTETHQPGEWSRVFRLHKSTLTQPGLTGGKDGRYNHLGDMPVLEWDNPDSRSLFAVEFAMDELFDQVLGCVNVTGTELDFSGADRSIWDVLEGVFYWRVSSFTDSMVAGPWSEIGRLSKTLISAPEIIGPDNGTAYAPRSQPAILEWEPLDTIDRYQIRLCVDPDCLYEIITLEHTGDPVFDFENDLGITEEIWWYAPFTLFWAICGFDESGRPGPFSEPREMIKPAYHRVAAYGDSITDGKCVDNGYLDMLHSRLTAAWGEKATTVNIAEPGMKSRWGAENMSNRLQSSCPQYVLIMFGTNDSVDPGNCDPPFECDVPGHLEDMIEDARTRGTVPIVSTIIPVNPEGNLAGAQDDVDANNDEIIDLVIRMGVDWVDLNGMFWDYGDLSDLFCDWGHPNEAGYEIMATGFFDAIMNANPG